MESKETYLKIQLGAARIEFKGDAALLKGGVLDVAKGLDRLQIPKVVEVASRLAQELEAARSAQADIQQALDSLSEMADMASLMMQQRMDRLSKMMSMLSNLIKQSSDTASAIVQNLK